jgi:hypothetical protein
MFAAGNAHAGDISFNVGKMYTTRKAGEAVVADGGTYVVVPITMKNLSNQKQSVGGIGHTSFTLKQGEFTFDIDGGVGWTFGNSEYFDGLAVLQPLMPQTLKVAFTVPTELIGKGHFILVMPDESEISLEDAAPTPTSTPAETASTANERAKAPAWAAGHFSYAVERACFTKTVGGETADKGTTYLAVTVEIKNTDHFPADLGNMFDKEHNFQVKTGDFTFEFLRMYRDSLWRGSERFAPLIPQIKTVVFLIPEDLTSKTQWTLVTPTGESLETPISEPLAAKPSDDRESTAAVGQAVRQREAEGAATPSPEFTPEAQPTPSPTSQTVESPAKTEKHDYDFIITIWTLLSNHDYEHLTPYLADGFVNYFGRKHASVASVVRDMKSEAARYSNWNANYYTNTFWREVSEEYSSKWQGPMIYDHIDMWSEVNEPSARWHRAHVRFTVGYTTTNNVKKIYALVYEVLPNIQNNPS